MTPVSTVLIDIHESGHAVLGEVLRLERPIEVVRIGGGAHVARYLPLSWEVAKMSRAEWLGFLERTGIAMSAGEAAVELLLGARDARRGTDHDRAKALALATALDPKYALSAQAQLFLKALALARQHRAAIERFAATLGAHHGRLAGAGVGIALDAALGGRPTPTLPGREAAVPRQSSTQVADLWQRAATVQPKG